MRLLCSLLSFYECRHDFSIVMIEVSNPAIGYKGSEKTDGTPPTPPPIDEVAMRGQLTTKQRQPGRVGASRGKYNAQHCVSLSAGFGTTSR